MHGAGRLNSRCFTQSCASSFVEHLKKLLEERREVLHPYAITTNGQFLYWTDWSKKTIHQWKITGQAIKSAEINNKRTAIENIRDLHIYDSLRQKPGNIILTFSIVHNLNELESFIFISFQNPTLIRRFVSTRIFTFHLILGQFWRFSNWTRYY